MEPVPAGVVALRDDRLGTRWRTPVAAFRLGRFPVREIDLDPAGGRRPVVGVSWLDAIELCNTFSGRAGLDPAYRRDPATGDVVWDTAADGYRLPTDAEWQHACKAGTTGYRYGEIDDIAWYAGNSGARLHDAGELRPNPWGLYDMLGNTWEWCWDLYDPDVYGPYRIFRGGGWAEPERGCGATVRRRSHPSFAIDDLGFRLARNG
jgi:formylglycine-generating enzyme required for sulfatase activity